MRFLREIPEDHLTQQLLNDLEQQGYILKWTSDSIEVWAKVYDN